MSYFQNFNPVMYKFGNETEYALATNITQYVDLVDQVKTRDVFLQDYVIPANERPDQTAFKLYGNASYYWTLFLVNDHIRENGWPLTQREVDAEAKRRYPHRMVTVKIQQEDVVDFFREVRQSDGTFLSVPIFRSKLIGTAPDQFEVGAVVTGSQTGTKGIIIKRDLALGTFIIDTENVVTESIINDQVVSPNGNGIVEIERTDSLEAETFTKPLLWVLTKDDVPQPNVRIVLDSFKRKATISDIEFDPTSTYKLTYHINTANTTDGKFIVGEELSYANPAGTQTSMIVFAESEQYNGPHHYEDADGNWVDIDPLTQNTSGATEITQIEYLRAHNESLRTIKVLRPETVRSVVNEFTEALSQ
jgi:hypothetical protein